MFSSIATPPKTKASQDTFNLMALALMGMETARKRAERLCVFDLDADTLLSFVEHRTSAIRTFASELALAHFPDRFGSDALVGLLRSPSEYVRERAKYVLISNHPGKLSDDVLHAFARSSDKGVRTLAEDTLRSRFSI